LNERTNSLWTLTGTIVVIEDDPRNRIRKLILLSTRFCEFVLLMHGASTLHSHLNARTKPYDPNKA
jgi:hypothetical protein